VRIAFIIQRYGAEVLGGSEHLCRLVAERLATTHDVDVLTSCAQDYVTWKNEYPEGADRVRGVTVRRFATARTRDIDAFNAFSEKIYDKPHSRQDEMEWLKQQGPWCPGLVDYLRRQHNQYDVLIFYTYLYAPTVLGLEVAPQRSILVSTAHDEPAIRLEIYKDVFRKPAALGYLTDSERRFVQEQFPERPLLEETLGVGIDLAQQQLYPRMPAPPDAEDGPSPSTAGGDASEPDSSEDRTPTLDAPAHLSERGALFRRRHRLYGPMVLYGGRIDPGKGCEELIQYFGEYVKDGGDGTLTLMGSKLMVLPEEPYIRFAGRLSDRERLQALEAATVVVCPSPYESLSLLALEALSVGTPILCNARSAVLVEHCVNSNGGLYYADRDEFVACLKLLVGDANLRAAMGRNGVEYVTKNYRWDVVLAKYERLFAKIRNAR
jgi:glycosyltransferase involved in cell wall biosynthesis